MYIQYARIINHACVCASIIITMNFIGGEDYEVPPNQYIKVIISAGVTTASFDIRIINDTKVEGNEKFRGTIFDLSVPYGFKLGSNAGATFTILDDDSKHTRICTNFIDLCTYVSYG